MIFQRCGYRYLHQIQGLALSAAAADKGEALLVAPVLLPGLTPGYVLLHLAAALAAAAVVVDYLCQKVLTARAALQAGLGLVHGQAQLP